MVLTATPQTLYRREHDTQDLKCLKWFNVVDQHRSLLVWETFGIPKGEVENMTVSG